jgi:ribonuclease HI
MRWTQNNKKHIYRPSMTSMEAPPINIAQWNARNIKTNQNALSQFVETCPSISVLAISETHLRPEDSLQLLDFVAYRVDRHNQKGGGVALFIHPQLPAEQIHFHTTLEAVAIRTIYKGKKTTIMSLYLPPNENTNKELEDLLSQIPHPAIICGDFNAHIQNHGSAYTNTRGRFLQRLANAKNFSILNTDQPTLLQRPNNNATAPDFTLVSDQLIDQLTWQVSELTLGSDHYLIQITTPVTRPVQRHNITPPPRRRKFEKANWDKYTTFLQLNVLTLSDHEVDTWYATFASRIQDAANISIPWSKPPSTNPRRPQKAWWSADCENAYKDMLRAQRTYRKNPGSLHNYIESKKHTAVFKRTSRTAKLLHWQNFCNSMTSQTHPSKIWKTVKVLKNGQITTTNPTLTPTDWQKDFLDRVAPAGQPPPEQLDWTALHGTSMPAEYKFYESKITRTEFDFELALVNKKAAPGPDNISYEMLQHLPEDMKDSLTQIYNYIWETSDNPLDWKNAWLIMVLKSGHKPGDEKSYRPILHTSCVAKLFEKIIKRRLVTFVEKNDLLPASQHGFRKGMNIQMCLADLISAVNLSFSKKQMHFALMVDVKGAFDNVPHKSLLEELYFAGLPKKLINWLENFLTGRTLFFHSTTQGILTRPLRKGVPQGGVLSPILYIIYVRALEHNIRRLFRIIQFADDALLHFGHSSMVTSRGILKDAIEALYLFFLQRGLELNPRKTIVMVFSKKKQPLHPINTIFGVIEMRENATYLGIHLDSQLNWKAQISSLAQRCQMPLNIIKSVAYVWWGADPTCLLAIYKALILSKLQNSCFLWQQAAQRSLRQLEIIQNTSMRKILGALPSTPIHSMQAELRLAPLKYAATKSADKLIIKLFQHGEHPATTNIRELAEKEESGHFTSNLRLLTKAYRKWTNSGITIRISNLPEYHPPQKLSEVVLDTPWMYCHKQNLPPDTLQKILEFLNTTAKNSVKIYTDGSKQSDGRTGTAFCSHDLNIAICTRPPNTYSIFSAEAIAVLNALQYVLQHKITQSVLICTDSQSLLKALTNPKSNDSNHFIIADIRTLLQDLSKNGQQAHLIWVPSHIGLKGNDNADKLALLGSQAEKCSTLDTPVPDLLRQINYDQYVLWDTHWRLTNLHKGREYAKLFPTEHLPKSPWFAAFKGLTRSFYSSICRLRFAHAPTPDRLFSWKLAVSPACACSFSPGTLEHQLFQCPKYSSARQQFNACLSSHKIHPPFHLPSLLISPNKQIYLALHDLYRYIFLQKV